MLQRRCIIPIGPAWEIYVHTGPLDEGIAALPEGLELATAKEFARTRMVASREHPINKEWFLVGESGIFFPDGTFLLTTREKNPILKNLNEAMASERSTGRVYLDDKTAAELREQAKTDPEEATKSGVLLIPRRPGALDIPGDCERGVPAPLNDLANRPVSRFLFGELAEKYGKWLQGFFTESDDLYFEHFYDTATVVQKVGRKPYAETLKFSPSNYRAIYTESLSRPRIYSEKTQLCAIREVPSERGTLEVPVNVLAALREGTGFTYEIELRGKFGDFDNVRKKVMYVPTPIDTIERAK